MWRVLTADLAQEQVLQRSCCSAGVAAQLVFASLRGCGLKGDASDSCRCCCASRTRVRLQLRLLNRGTRHAPAFTNCLSRWLKISNGQSCFQCIFILSPWRGRFPSRAALEARGPGGIWGDTGSLTCCRRQIRTRREAEALYIGGYLLLWYTT